MISCQLYAHLFTGFVIMLASSGGKYSSLGFVIMLASSGGKYSSLGFWC